MGLSPQPLGSDAVSEKMVSRSGLERGQTVALLVGWRRGDAGHRCSRNSRKERRPQAEGRGEVADASSSVSENNAPFELLGWES